MKIAAYSVRDDEEAFLQQAAEEAGCGLVLIRQKPEAGNLSLAEGCEGVTIVGETVIDEAILQTWKDLGVRYLSTRTIGFDHIDLEAARRLGISVCNADYSPVGVSEFTLLMMLLCIRHYKQALWRLQVNDYSLGGLQGRELGSMTVGVAGAGKIGAAVIRLLSSFGCKILVYNRSRRPEIEAVAEYVSLDELFARSDMITLHLPYNEATHHIINSDSIAKMKDGVIIINCARGELCDTRALIRGIESGRIGALGLDVIEDERGIAHVNHKTDIISNEEMAYLRQFKNVVMTPHMAFYTDDAVRSMAFCGIRGLAEMAGTGTTRTMLK